MGNNPRLTTTASEQPARVESTYILLSRRLALFECQYQQARVDCDVGAAIRC